ncbi:MAG TPA: C45 family peptidase [Nocardioidaceae bacterium]
MTYPLIRATGTPEEIGASYGEQAAELIAGNLEDYRTKFAAVGLGASDVTRIGDQFAATTREYTPRIAAMLDAVAESSGTAVGDVYALNARTELMLPDGLRITECTSVAVLPEHTATGNTLLAQNWDWHPSQRPFMVVLATRDERGHEVVTLAEAGMLAKAGLSSAGLGICVNLLHSDRDGAPGGVPYHVLIRHVLDQPGGLAYAMRVTALPRSASINLLIAAAGGTAVDLEVAPGMVGRITPQDGLLTHANHFVSGIPLVDAIYDTGGSSLFRDYRMRQLLAVAGADRKVLVDDVIAALQDHLGLPYAICRHVDEEDPENLKSMSAASVVMDLDERVMLVASGPPCETAYEHIDLSTVFDSA